MKIRLLCASLALAFAAAANAAPFTVKIIGFNDYHGNLQTPGTFGQNTSIPSSKRPVVGGAEYMAGLVNQLKSQNPLNVVVGAGDLIGASPLISGLFHDESAIETLNKIGLEFSSVGNHEFDQGRTELLRQQAGGCKITNGLQDPTSCRGYGSAAPGTFDGAKFKWLSANVVDTASGKTLLPAYGIKTFNGVKVAFVGMTLQATPTIVTPSGVAGLTFKDEADTVNALVPRLRAQGIESIVVLIHQGGFQGAGFSDINGCDGNLVGSDLAPIVARLDNAVDLVVSAHTHAAYNCSANTVDVQSINGVVTSTTRSTAAGLPNKVGRKVPVTSASAFGRVITDIDVDIDPATRDIVAVRPTNRLVDQTAVTPDATVAAIVSKYNADVSPIANQVLGTLVAPVTSAADAAGVSDAGALIADAQLLATSAAPAGAVLAFMNAGGVRGNGFTKAGDVTYGNAFTLQPFGNSLVTKTLTAQNLKDVLEQQFAGCLGQGSATRIMQPSAGFKYDYAATAACGSRISNVRFVDLQSGVVVDQLVDVAGNVVNPSKTYRVTMNSFMATGGDGFAVFNQGTNPVGGAQDIDALSAYLSAFNVNVSGQVAYDPAAVSLQKPRAVKK